MSCEHKNFFTQVDVHRTSDGEGAPIQWYSADIHIKCTDCDMPFKFLTNKIGLHDREPMASVDLLELRVPIHPNDGTEPLPPKVRGFTITGIQGGGR